MEFKYLSDDLKIKTVFFVIKNILFKVVCKSFFFSMLFDLTAAEILVDVHAPHQALSLKHLPKYSYPRVIQLVL